MNGKVIYWLRGWRKHVRSTNRRKAFSIKKHWRRQPENTENGMKERKIFQSKILTYLDKITVTKKPNNKNYGSKVTYILPKKFCFIDDPGSTLVAIKEICDRMDIDKLKRIEISHGDVRSYNLTSEVLLGIFISKKNAQNKLKNKKIRISGILPNDDDHRQLVNEIGIVKELDIIASQPPHSREKQHLFERYSANISQASAFSEDDKTKATAPLVRHVEECLKDKKLSLTDMAIRKLTKIISEVLDNAERHSSRNGGAHIWYLRGYLNSSSILKILKSAYLILVELFLNPLKACLATSIVSKK